MIITLAQQKGGVGKSTASIVLSQFFSFIKKYKVLAIDMDPQSNMTTTLLKQNSINSLKQVVLENTPLSDVIQHTSIQGLDIIPSNISMEELESYLISIADGPYKLKDIIEDYSLQKKYDFIILDTPPHLGRLTVSSLVASDYVIIPLENKVFAADGLSKLFDTISVTVKRFNKDLNILGAFINKYESRTIISRDIINAYMKSIPDLLFNTKIRFNIRIEECIAEKDILFTYDPKSYGATDFAALGDEILNKLTEHGQFIPMPSSLS